MPASLKDSKSKVPAKAEEAPTPVAESTPAALAKWDMDLEDLYYGIYLNGSKMGWMNTRVTGTADEVVVSTEMNAKITGMGTVSQIELTESRRYRASDGLLVGIAFRQAASTGAVEITGTLVGEQIELKVNAGTVTSLASLPATESLKGYQQVRELVKTPVVGAKASGVRLDASALKVLTVNHTVQSVEKKVFGGVEVSAVTLNSEYPAMSLSETAWYDNAGKLLETKIGGFFVARLEAPDVAKRLDYQQDLLVASVVATPAPIKKSASLSRLQVDFEGFGEFPLPESARQRVKKRGSVWSLTLSKDEVPPVVALGSGPDEQEFVKATPFVQSDAPEMIEAAWKAVGSVTDRWTAVQRLVPFVYSHVEDEYVAAFSNAMEALRSGRGDCTEHSVLFVALARAIGIPARTAVGIAYWPAGKGFGWHAWAEVKIGKKWYAVDPTWNQPIADATHIKLAQGGPAEQAKVVMLLGKLKVLDVTL